VELEHLPRGSDLRPIELAVDQRLLAVRRDVEQPGGDLGFATGEPMVATTVGDPSA
jgi:hypothetical protein